MKEKKPVKIRTQIIWSFIPYLNIYAYYRIKKIRRWFLNGLISSGIGIATTFGFFGLGLLLPDYSETISGIGFVFGLIDSLIINSVLAARKMKKWSIEWNEKLTN